MSGWEIVTLVVVVLGIGWKLGYERGWSDCETANDIVQMLCADGRSEKDGKP